MHLGTVQLLLTPHRFFWRAKLKNKSIKVFRVLTVALLTLLDAFILLADEKIIQQEEISFEKCLNVITTSQDKLSIAAEINEVPDQKRVAVFTLADGTLTITCNGIEGNVVVTTNMD